MLLLLGLGCMLKGDIEETNARYMEPKTFPDLFAMQSQHSTWLAEVPDRLRGVIADPPPDVEMEDAANDVVETEEATNDMAIDVSTNEANDDEPMRIGGID